MGLPIYRNGNAIQMGDCVTYRNSEYKVNSVSENYVGLSGVKANQAFSVRNQDIALLNQNKTPGACGQIAGKTRRRKMKHKTLKRKRVR